jgi:hypothetical protein
MGRLLHILITLPLIVSPLSLLAADTSHGATFSQMDALRLLAKSKAADGKCKILGPAEADELGSYLARAEVAATQRNSIEDAQGTIALGKTLGSTAPCDSATAAEVSDTLDAARRAMVAVEEAENSREQYSQRKVKRVQAERDEEARSRPAVTVKRYRQQAFAYYLERRCQHLSARQAHSFWSNIIQQHRSLARKTGGKAVAAAARSAEAEAARMSCGSESRRIVRVEYSESSAF